MKKDCLFCTIVHGETDTKLLYQDASVVVFKDIHPQAPVHLLIVPKTHIRSINNLTAADAGIVADMIRVAKDMAGVQGITDTGYRLIFNVERGGGQVIFHLHLHLMGGWHR